ncbi:MAG: enoyl-CoA hydratase [Rhodovibrionaceae bacterium]|nr:enoyl-CoA hydratase [Rhodovibrionaceae bacterium]
MNAASATTSPAASQTAETASESYVLREDRNGVARLTLNRPKAYNALSTGMMSALQAELDAIKDDSQVRAVIIAGSGRGFCAGHDLKELRSRKDRAFYEEVFSQCSRLMMSVVELPRPVIAQAHGIATAAGCQLVASCDLAVAADSTRFGTPGVNIGLFCSTPMVALSRNVPRKIAMEMLLTGEQLDAHRAVEFGLINKAVPEEKLEEEADSLAARIVAKSPYVLKIGKEAFYRQLERPLKDAYTYTSEVMVTNMMARDAAEGIDAFLEKRDPVWHGE